MAKKFIKKVNFSYEDKGPNYEVNMYVDLDRFEQQYSKAQYLLDSQVMTSMIPFMPMQSGTFINATKAMSAAIAGSGKVVAAAPPFGRFLYKGKTMVDVGTGSPFARKGAKKVLVSQYSGKTNAKEDLEFSKAAHPKAQPEWFEAAKKADKDKWIKATKQLAGGGTSGR